MSINGNRCDASMFRFLCTMVSTEGNIWTCVLVDENGNQLRVLDAWDECDGKVIDSWSWDRSFHVVDYDLRNDVDGRYVLDHMYVRYIQDPDDLNAMDEEVLLSHLKSRKD